MAVDKTVNNLYIKASGSIYFYPSGGDITTDGCIQIKRDGDDLVVWKKLSGVWVEIWRYTA